MTMVMSFCCKSLDLDDDDIDEDEEKATVAEKALWYRESRCSERSEFYPIEEKVLAQMREDRIEEVAMWNIVKEITHYLSLIHI